MILRRRVLSFGTAREGRPTPSMDIREEISERMASGMAPAAIAKVLGVDRKSVVKYALRA